MPERSVNKVMLLGRLGNNAETKFTPSGVSNTKFSIATTQNWKDKTSGEWKSETTWTNVVLWRQENVAQYLLKGAQVYVEGRLSSRSYDDKDGKKVYVTEVVGDQVILLGGGKQASGNDPDDAYHNQTQQHGATGRKSASQEIRDDDVPF